MVAAVTSIAPASIIKKFKRVKHVVSSGAAPADIQKLLWSRVSVCHRSKANRFSLNHMLRRTPGSYHGNNRVSCVLTTWGSQLDSGCAFKYQVPDEPRQSRGSLVTVQDENALEAPKMLAQ